MATFSFLQILFISSILIIIQLHQCTAQLILPIIKHETTNQYTTQIHLGTPLQPTKLMIDLDSSVLWTSCTSLSSTQTRILCRSIQCSAANANTCTSTNSVCSLSLKNSIKKAEMNGKLVEDVLALQSPDASVPHTVIAPAIFGQFLFSCGSSILRQGLVNEAQGILGLSKSRISFPQQVSNKLGLPQKFSLCLSRNNGVLVMGPDSHLDEHSKSLVYTPLNTYDSSSYSINIRSIKIQGKKISLSSRSSLLARISTVSPYTKLHSGIYETFLKAFDLAVDSLNMARVPSVLPFGVCYRTKDLALVPVIDLGLQSEMVNWRINGGNSLVKMSEDVFCLGFVDGGMDLDGGADVVIGGYQLEDNLLEFDFGRGMFGFSSGLISNATRTSCNEFYYDLIYKNLQES